jgi:hypothetical protein
MTFFVEQNNEDAKPQPGQPGPATTPRENGAKVGQLLKARRLELGLKHKDIFKEIKIKPEYLRAIEDEEFDKLPTPEYLRLFIRTYAQHLGFDIQEIYGIFDTQEMPVIKSEKKDSGQQSQQPPESQKSRLKTYIWGSICAVIILFVLVVWIFGPGEEPPPAQPKQSAPAVADSTVDSVKAQAELTIPVIPPTPQCRLYIRGLDSTWMVIQADDDTVFLGFIEENVTKSWVADSSFKFSLSNYDGVETAINGRYLKPFRQWNGPVRAREVGGYNLDRYLDSTRMDQSLPEVEPE